MTGSVGYPRMGSSPTLPVRNTKPACSYARDDLQHFTYEIFTVDNVEDPETFTRIPVPHITRMNLTSISEKGVTAQDTSHGDYIHGTRPAAHTR